MRAAALRATAFLVTAVFLCSLVPSGTAVPNDPENRWADIQGIAAGDYWDFRISGQDNGEVHNEMLGGVTTKRNAFGTSEQTYRIHASGTIETRQSRDDPVTGEPREGAPVEVQIDLSKWVRTTDYAVHYIEGQTEIGGYPVNIKESYQPALVETIFPFQEGYKWRSAAKDRVQRGSEVETYDVRLTVEVLGIEEVQVPAGTFRAWKILISGGREASEHKIQWYSEEVCDLVKEERYDDKKRLINKMELTDYRCSRIPKDNPTYDPRYVTLLAVGAAPPAGSDAPAPEFLPDTTEESKGAAVWIVALALVAVASTVMIVAKRRGT